MTNPKDEDKPKVKKKGKGDWKKVDTVIKAVDSISKRPQARPSGHRKRRESAPVAPGHGARKILTRQASSITPESVKPADSASSVERPVVRRTVVQRRRSSALILKEPEPDQNDPQAAYRNTVFELIKNTFSLAFGEEGELRINVDNVYPILKTIGLNPRSESIMDLVRDASMESIGDIDPADFEKVIMAMVRTQDEDIWNKRLEEKEFDRIHKESEKAKDEAEKLRIAREREKVGFEQEEEEKKDEWAELEKQKEEEANEKKKEAEIDELYDNLKMAFRFIDADGDGVISTQDIYGLMMGLGEMLTDDELFGMVNLADLDCDGKVTFEDFRRFLATAEELEAADKEEQIEESKTTDQTQPEEETTANENVVEGTADVTDSSTDKPTPEANTEQGTDKNIGTVPSTPNAVGPNEEERMRRKRSMLWGYMSSASKLVTTMQKTDEEASNNKTTAESVLPEVKEPTAEPETATAPAVDQVDASDATALLGAIREEDEHSNYDLEATDRVDSTIDNKITNMTDTNKRRIVSRQSSSASIKIQGLTGADSVVDSGIETMNGSEIREQPDMLDLSDDDDNEGVPTDSKQPIKRRGSLSTLDIYTTDDEDDEDMVEAHHVHESLSRVSSMESLEGLKDKLPTDDDDKESRVRSFVNQHMYIDIRQESMENKLSDEREVEDESLARNEIDETKMARAHLLQKAILRRSLTAPNLTMATSKIGKPSTPKPSVNGIMCSHIDIDLTCESPPKADIKSTVLFNKRVTSARLNKSRPDSARSTKTISVVDISETVGNDGTISQSADKSRWPMRPLTRPRSPRFRRITSATSRNTSSDNGETCELSIDVISDKNIRAKSAKPFRRTSSAVSPRSVLPKQSVRQRPQTARPYATTRTIVTPVTKYEKKDNISVVITEPFKNATELYPRKELLTTYHHGFKSIWPVGRKANLIQSKRPFSAFEMNSYSRSIERSEFPLHISENISKLNTNSKRTVPTLLQERGLLLPESKIIKLELAATLPDKPFVVRNSSSSLNPGREITRPKIVSRLR